MPKWNLSAQDPPAPGESASAGVAPSRTAAPGTVARPADLYARWAIATRWRGFARGSDQSGERRNVGADDPADERPTAIRKDFAIRIIARAPDESAFKKALKAKQLKIPDLYRRPVPGAQGKTSLYFTAQLELTQLQWLVDNPLALTWELAMPLHQAQTIAQATTVGRYGPQREEATLAARSELKFSHGDALATAAESIGDAIAIIDFGCPFLHQKFARGKSGSRIVALWDQSDRLVNTSGTAWAKPGDGLYGRELNARMIRKIVRQVGSQPFPDETATYRGIDYLIAYDDPRRRAWFATHGGHVTDMAAGSPDPLKGVCGLESDDAACRADIVFVQLPALTAADSSGGSLSAHLLDAVRYAMHVCKPTANLVVSISYGSFAGPHDGSSMIERAFDDLLALRQDNFAIVLAAGNARQAHCHARRISAKDKSALLRFAITPADTTDTFLELWYTRPANNAGLKVRVRTAGRDWSHWVGPGMEAALWDEATAQPLAVLQQEARSPHRERSLVLLALVPTASAIDDEGPLNAPGLWELEVALIDNGGGDLAFDAWIERDDPGDFNGLGGAAQPSFLGLDVDDDRNTLSSIATGDRTIVVGGYRWGDGSVASYSSLPAQGVARAKKGLPLLMAPCELDPLQPSLQAAAVRSNDAFRMNGTSVAAPVVARRLFDFMVRSTEPTRTSPEMLERLVASSFGVIRLAEE